MAGAEEPTEAVTAPLVPADASEPRRDLRQALATALEEAGVGEGQADSLLGVGLALCCVVLAAAIWRLAALGKGAAAAHARQKQAELAERKQRAKAAAAAAPTRPAHRPSDGINGFGSIMQSNARARERRELQPRVAWLGKAKFTRTPDPARLQHPQLTTELTRCRCWFGSECYRTGARHKAQYAHPGDDDWTERTVVLRLAPATAETVASTARAFTKAGGRGEFVHTAAAGRFLREYSGLPPAFLKKIREMVAGLSEVPRLRREQFAYAVRAVDALQAALAEGDVTIDDIVLDGTGGPKTGESGKGLGLPPGVAVEMGRRERKADRPQRVGGAALFGQ